MARSYAKLKGSIWRDHDWRQLDTPAQRLYLLLLSQPEITNCGVVPYVPTRWATMASDTTVEDVLRIISVLHETRFIVVDEHTAEVLIRSFVKHDQVVDQPKIRAAAVRQYDDIQSPIIRTTLADEYPDLFHLRPGETPAKKATESLSQTLPDGHTVAPACAHARQPVPVTATSSPPDGETLAAAAEELRTAGWSTTQIATATDNNSVDRAIAWLHHAQADPTCRQPGALAWTKFLTGTDPPEQRSTLAPGATGTRSTTTTGHPCPHCGITTAGPNALADHIANIHYDADPSDAHTKKRRPEPALEPAAAAASGAREPNPEGDPA